MLHELRPHEESIVATLLERFRFEYVPVRLSKTMLNKAIIDARAPLQALLRSSGIVDFGAIRQGAANKLRLPVPVVTARGSESRITSFYRPESKDGDPRIWIERLSSEAVAGDLLLFILSGTSLSAAIVSADVEELSKFLAPFVLSRFEERGQLEETARRIATLLAPLRSKWIRTLRRGPTGVGYTLETLLRIPANSRQVADVDGVELKAYRRGSAAGEGKLVTLFSKTPQWLSSGKGAGLLSRFGYQDDVRGRSALYCTITSKRNTLGWHLNIEIAGGRISVAHMGEQVLYYTFATLEKRLKEKHPATLFIKASSRGAGDDEEFRYDEVVLCREPSFANFIDLAIAGTVGLDFTLHLKENGRSRDHGYLWRIREARIPGLYAYRKLLSEGN